MAAKKPATKGSKPLPYDGPFHLPRRYARAGETHLVALTESGLVERSGSSTTITPRTDPAAVLEAAEARQTALLDEGFREVVEPLPADVTESVVLDAAALARIHPFRAIRGERPVVDESVCAASIRAVVATLGSYLDDAEGGADGDYPAVVRAAVTWLKGSLADVPADAGVIGMALFLLSAANWRSTDAHARLVDLIVSRHGVSLATSALVTMTDRTDPWVVLPMSDDADAQQPGGEFATTPGPWRRLREHLAHAEPSAYEAAVAVARAAWDRGSRALRVPLGYAFPDVSEWSDACIRAARGTMSMTLAPERWLLTSCRDSELLWALANETEPFDVFWRGRTAATEQRLAASRSQPWKSRIISVLTTIEGAPCDDVTLSLAAGAGENAARALVLLASNVTRSNDGKMPYEVIARRAVFDAFTRLPTKGTIDELVPMAAYVSARDPGAFDALLAIAEIAPRRVLAALASHRAKTPSHVRHPHLEQLAAWLAPRVEGASATRASGATADVGDATALVARIAASSGRELEALLDNLPPQRLAGLAAGHHGEVVAALENRAANEAGAARVLAAIEISRSNPQYAANWLAGFLATHDNDAVARELAELVRDGAEREGAEALEAFVARGRGEEERIRRRELVAR